MKKATCELVLGVGDIPAGATPGKFRATLTQPDGSVQVQDVDAGPFVFDCAIAGAYSVSVLRVDVNGAQLSIPVSTTFSIAETYEFPTAVTVTLE